MDSKLLSYESLKNVLLYMDANMRFQISNKCPTIRKTEKIVPLKIEFLQFDHMRLTVNKTEYNMGIYRKYQGDKVPGLIDYTNKNGGKDQDVDQFGFGNADVYNVLTPGDVLIKDRVTVIVPNGEAERLEFERQLIELEKEMNIQQKLYAGSNHRIRHEAQSEIRRLESSIEYHRTHLLPHYWRRDNTPAPFDNFLQLTITSPNGEHIERLNYNQKLYEAQKYLSCVFFGNRLSILNVKRLKISYDHMIIRLPLGVKFMIRELETHLNLAKMYEALKSIVDQSSYPLDVLYLRFVFQIHNNQNHSIVKNAKKLIIGQGNVNAEHFASLQIISHQKVHLSVDSQYLTVENRIILIRTWMETGREIGTIFTFGLKTGATATNILESIKNQFDTAISGEKSITLPMSPISKLKVSYKAVSVDEYFKEPWLLIMEVVPVESEKKNVSVEPQ